MIYKTKGTCAREIQIEIQDNVLQEVKFVGGCMGNTLGVASLVKGMEVEDVRRHGTRQNASVECGRKACYRKGILCCIRKCGNAV